VGVGCWALCRASGIVSGLLAVGIASAGDEVWVESLATESPRQTKEDRTTRMKCGRRSAEPDSTDLPVRLTESNVPSARSRPPAIDYALMSPLSELTGYDTVLNTQVRGRQVDDRPGTGELPKPIGPTATFSVRR